MSPLVQARMEARLRALFTHWQHWCQTGGPAAEEGPLTAVPPLFAPLSPHLVLVQLSGPRYTYAHYGSALQESFGADLAGETLAFLPPDVLSRDRRAMLEWEYACVQRTGQPVWRRHTGDFGHGPETWQRLAVPLNPETLLVGAVPDAATAPPPEGVPGDVTAHALALEATHLLSLMTAAAPVLLDAQGRVNDLAVSLQDLGRSHADAASFAEQALTDPLTGLANGRAFRPRANAEMEAARLVNRELAFLLLDLDHFKQVNDTHGHAMGDAVLKAFGATLTTTLREADLAARWGGEEFVVMLPNTGPEAAQLAAEKIRRVLHAKPGPLVVTASIGVTVTDGTETLETVLNRADTALYGAKYSGRDRVNMLLADF